METNDTNQGKVLGNVGVLDIRHATEASVAEIRRIGNVGSVFFSPETAPLLTQLNIGNVGTTLEVPNDVKFLNGQQVFGRDSFKNQAEPLNMMVNGQVIIKADVPEEDVEQGLGFLIINGQIICPEYLAGLIQAKTRDLNGQMIIYEGQPQVVIGNVTLNEAYLSALEDGTELMVVGKVSAPQVLANDLIQQKIQKLYVIGNIICREENAQTLLARVDSSGGSAEVTTIPSGFEWIERSVVLDSTTLTALPARNLYCSSLVQIGPDVDASRLDQYLDKLVAKDLLICPASLRDALAQKCNLLETQVIFYEGELWLVESEMALSAPRFDYLTGKATLVVRGEATVAADIDPKVLADRFDKVHNFGEISCTSPQRGALQARLGFNEGEFIDSEAADEGEDGIGNVGFLRL